MVIVIAGYLLVAIQWTHPVGKPYRATLIQGNIPQQLRWSEAYLDETLQTYQNLTEQHWDSDIIVWPEGAIPLPMAQAENFIQAISKAAKQHHTTWITGIPIAEPGHTINER